MYKSTGKGSILSELSTNGVDKSILLEKELDNSNYI